MTKSKIIVIAIILLVIYLIITAPILQAGFYSDDVANNLVLAQMQVRHMSLWQYSSLINTGMLNSGRAFPITVYAQFIFFYLFQTQHDYQLARIICIILSALSAAWCVKLIMRSIHAGLLWLLFFPIFWQIRDYHDPLTSFSLQLPLLVSFVCLSLAFFVKFNELKKITWLWLSVLMYVGALLTYEVGCATFMGIAILAYFKKVTPPQAAGTYKQYCKIMLPYFIVSLVYFGYCFYLRHHPVAPLYLGVAVGSMGKHFFATVATQWLGAIPLTYWYIVNPSYAIDFHSWFVQHVALKNNSILLLILGLPSVYFLLTKLIIDKKRLWSIGLVGFFLTLIPSILMGMSARYQIEMHWGYAYLPVYLEYVGMAFILLALAASINKLPCVNIVKKLILALFVLLWGLTLCLSFVHNSYIVSQENNGWRYSREIMQNAMQHQFFHDLPKTSVVMVRNSSWQNPLFYKQYGNLTLDVINITDTKQLYSHNTPDLKNIYDFPNQPLYFMNFDFFPDTATGYMIMGKFSGINKKYENKKLIIDGYVIENPRVFLSFDSSPNHITNELLKNQFINLSKNSLVNLDQQIAKSRKDHPDWALVDLPVGVYTVAPY